MTATAEMIPPQTPRRETRKEFHMRMQRIAGIVPRPLSRRVGSHLRFRCGDVVTLKEDERQVGRVESTIQGMVRVTWRSTGWVSQVDPDDLKIWRHEND